MVDVDTAPITLLSLCSGVGMLDEGLCIAEPRARVVAYIEREASAAAVLLSRMDDECLEPAPIFCGNLEDAECGRFAGLVDGVVAGFPCQPHSQAGKRAGTDDERWIWPGIVNIIRLVGPRFVFLENVPGLLSSGGMGPVLGDLAALGFDIEWGCVSARVVGAAHRRERVFILAVANGSRPVHGGACVEPSEADGFTGRSAAEFDACGGIGRMANALPRPIQQASASEPDGTAGEVAAGTGEDLGQPLRQNSEGGGA